MTSDAFYIALIFFVVGAALFPLLFQEKIVAGDETFFGYYQYGAFYKQAIETGDSFLWNPHSYGGFPTYVNQFGGFFSPITYIVFKISANSFLAYNIILTLALLGGMIFSYLFGRVFFSRQASFILACTYAMVQNPPTFFIGLSYAHSFLILPWLSYAIIKAKRSSSLSFFWLFIALGGAGAGIGFVAGYIPTLMIVFVFAGFFAIFLDFFEEKMFATNRYRATVALLFMILAGLVTSASQLIGVYKYLPYTARTAAFAFEALAGGGVSWIEFARWFVPQNFPIPFDSGGGFFYVGLLPLFLIGAAALFYRSTHFLFFGISYVITLAFAMKLPGIEWVLTHVPFFNRTGNVNRWLLIGALPLSAVAAYGFDYMAALKQKRFFWSFWKIFRVLTLFGVAAFASLSLFILGGAQSPKLRMLLTERILDRRGQAIKHPIDYYADILQRYFERMSEHYSFSDFYVLYFIISSLLGLVILHFFITRENIKYARIMIVALVAATFIVNFSTTWRGFIPSYYFSQKPTTVQIIQNREKNPGAYRFATITGDALWKNVYSQYNITVEEDTLLSRELLYRDGGIVYGLKSISGFEPIRSLRQNQLIDTALALNIGNVIDTDAIRRGERIDGFANHVILKNASAEEKAADVVKRIPLFSMMNVKYLISLYPLRDERLTELVVVREPLEFAHIYLYENSTVLPKIYFASRPMIWKENNERKLLLEMIETPDFSKKTIIECADCSEEYAMPGKNSIAIQNEHNGFMAAEVSSEFGGWLVFGESNLPGWIANIGGQRASVYTANYLFQTIYIPQGAHQIEFRYVGSFALFLERLGVRKL